MYWDIKSRRQKFKNLPARGIDYCHEKGIVLVGYRPFGDKTSSEIFQNDIFKEIALRLNSSVQAVILQWINQHGVTAIPHSNKNENIQAT
ncbi:MAG: hypothetical protein LW832_07250 [Parachlamydia sp.]|jgi:diketogulonate reductase-like aldo/keto reductase|nr:hypothetical protein [Parachlamydia sp.]